MTAEGRRRPRRRKDDENVLGGVARILAAYEERARLKDPESLRPLAEIRDQIEGIIDRTAQHFHDTGEYTWAEIARQMGMTRQGAWYRWVEREQERPRR